VHDIGIGEQNVVRRQRLRLPQTLRDRPHLACPAGFEQLSVQVTEASVRYRQLTRKGSRSIGAVVVYQHDLWLAVELLNEQRSQSICDVLGLIPGWDHDRHLERTSRVCSS
jgi:hypothetical protein